MQSGLHCPRTPRRQAKPIHVTHAQLIQGTHTVRRRCELCRRATHASWPLMPADQPIRDRESINVLRLMPKLRHTAALGQKPHPRKTAREET